MKEAKKEQNLVSNNEVAGFGVLAGVAAAANEFKRQVLDPIANEARKAGEPLMDGAVKAAVEVINSQALKDQAVNAITHTTYNYPAVLPPVLAMKKGALGHILEATGGLLNTEDKRNVLSLGVNTLKKIIGKGGKSKSKGEGQPKAGGSEGASTSANAGASTSANAGASTSANAGASTSANAGASGGPSTSANAGASTSANAEPSTSANAGASGGPSTSANAGATGEPSTSAKAGASGEASTSASGYEPNFNPNSNTRGDYYEPNFNPNSNARGEYYWQGNTERERFFSDASSCQQGEGRGLPESGRRDTPGPSSQEPPNWGEGVQPKIVPDPVFVDPGFVDPARSYVNETFRDSMKESLKESVKESVKESAKESTQEALVAKAPEAVTEVAKSWLLLGLDPLIWTLLGVLSGGGLLIFTFKGKIFGGDNLQLLKGAVEAKQEILETKLTTLTEKTTALSSLTAQDQITIGLQKKANVELALTNDLLVTKLEVLTAKFGVPLALYETFAGALSDTLGPVVAISGVGLLGYRQLKKMKTNADELALEEKEFSEQREQDEKAAEEQLLANQKQKEELLEQRIVDLMEKMSSMSSVGSQKRETTPEAPLQDSAIPIENAGGQPKAQVKGSPESNSLEEQLLENMRLKDLKSPALGKKMK